MMYAYIMFFFFLVIVSDSKLFIEAKHAASRHRVYVLVVMTPVEIVEMFVQTLLPETAIYNR